MADHLPECLVPDFDKGLWICVCNQLRVCEQRVARAFHVVRKDDINQWERFARDQFDAGYCDGYDAALDSALEAVENLPDVIFQQAAWVKHDMAMDALNALRKGER